MGPISPAIRFAVLPHADGSADYKFAGYEVVATVNGPIEPHRRDELPEAACLEVNVREASGSGGPRTRLLETLIHRTLQPLLDLTTHPRTLIQVTLQLVHVHSDSNTTASSMQHDSILPVLPHAINAAVCALLNGNIAMKAVAVAAGVWTLRHIPDAAQGNAFTSSAVEPSVSRNVALQATHVFAYTSEHGLLLAESEGDFTFEEWDQAATFGAGQCLGGNKSQRGLVDWLRSVLSIEISERRKWIQSG